MPTAIKLRPLEQHRAEDRGFYAITRGHNTTGPSAGDALNALLADLAPGEIPERIVIGRIGDDEFYDAVRVERLEQLTERLAEERRGGLSLTGSERAELERLVEEEEEAVVRRSEAIAADLSSKE